MQGWKNDKRWSDRFLPEIKQILGLHLIGEPPIEEDQERNTDLIVLKMDAVRIGCRMRRNEYLKKYPNDFTMRAGRPSGAKTELTKIIEGWGDYFFYGFANEDDSLIAHWILGDLKVFRRWFVFEICKRKGSIPGVKKENGDNSSVFMVFSINDLPCEFFVATNN